MFYVNCQWACSVQFCNLNMSNGDPYMALLYLPQIITLCAHCTWVPWETYSEKVYWEGPLRPTAGQDEGIQTGQRGSKTPVQFH